MKALTSIHLMSGGDSVGVDSKFFTDNGQLQSLNLLSTSLTGDLKFLKHLREITLMPADSGKNIPLSDEQLGRLVSLNFYGTRFEPAQIKQLKHLRKLSTSLALNQENFDAICKSSDNLRIIHLTTAGENPAGIKSFAVFEQLPKLQMLVISDTIPDPLSLTKLKQLQYLSIPDKDYNDKVYLDNLQKSLPNTVITPNSGFCLGSGWLLLLVPLTIFLLFIYKPSAEE
jgi:hypothetical protein